MFRFTIRDVLWLMVTVGLALGWWAEHQWITKRSLAERFEHEARRWEAWCDRQRFFSDLRGTEHDSVDALVAMGDKIIPMIFDRWKQEDHIDGAPLSPPWWAVLERITAIKMVSDKEKAAHLPIAIRPADTEIPELQKKRWSDWWEREGKPKYGIR
jgi:hypothetical protein